MKWICILFSITFWCSALAQNHCFTGLIKTDRLGPGTEFIRFDAEFDIGMDSIVLLDLSNRKNLMVFSISQATCHWSSDYRSGKSEYEVTLKATGRKAKVNIIYNEARKVIELDYEGSKEKRVFRISELKGYVYR